MMLSVREKLEQGPMFDMAIVGHGFTPYMRDYDVLVDVVGPEPSGSGSQVIGRCRYRFTHCVLAEVTTAVQDDVWRKSWQHTFIDYEDWLVSGEPDGYVWGVQWMNAYPGLTYLSDSAAAREWSERLASPMHEVFIETNAHNIRLIFHDVEITWLSQNDVAR